MVRPTGYTIAAVLIAIASASAAAMLFISPPWAGLGVPAPPRLAALILADAVAGLIAVWALWQAQRWAPEACAVWAISVLANLVSQQFHLFPAMFARAGMPIMIPPPTTGQILVGLVVWGALLGLGYWYLHTKRPAAGA